LRYAEVQALLADRKFRTPGADLLTMQGITTGPVVEMMKAFLLNTNGAAHSRLRRLLSSRFTPRSVENFRPRMREVANELLDAMAAHDSCDFMEAFAKPYSWRLLCEFVGIPSSALANVQKWNADIALMFGLSVTENYARIHTALLNLQTFLDELVAARRRAPENDLLSDLVSAGEAGDVLTDTELRALVITLMSAGSDTTNHQLGHILVTFMDHPEQWVRLAKQPTLAIPAVEEAIRISPASILGVPRIATEEGTWNGLRISPGQVLLPVTGSANRDAAVFEQADVFDISRKGPPHLTFGGGIHYCLGAVMARTQLQEALTALAGRLSNLRPAGHAEWRPPTEAVYGPTRLPIQYGLQ
jgi:cytochrome P450